MHHSSRDHPPDLSANPYDRRYSGDGTYWGTHPSSLCDRVIELLLARADHAPTLIDLGCGEGRNAVYLARHGFQVPGLDTSLHGLVKARKYASESGVSVETIHDDVCSCSLARMYDVVFSTGLVHYIPPEIRRERFAHFKSRTSPRGFNAHSALVWRPFLDPAPDAEPDVTPFQSGELMSYYWDWEIVYGVEEVFDCLSPGLPHKHAVNRLIARRWEGE